MRISTKTRYGVRLMLNLALAYGKGPKFLNEIEAISEKYLGHIVAVLKSAGLITSFRGAKGGYALSRNPAKISLREIVEPLEGDMSIIERHGTGDGKISQRVSNTVWAELSNVIQKTLESHNLEDLTRMCSEEYNLIMYNI